MIDRGYRLADDATDPGLNCTPDGLSLAGIPLLRRTPAGLATRPPHEIDALIQSAYDRDIEVNDLSRGLEIVAMALNRGDLGRAQIAALRLQLPALRPEGAMGIAQAEEALVKYDPNEPRDSQGRWTTGAASPSGGTAALRPTHRSGHVPSDARQRMPTLQANRAPRLIPVSDTEPTDEGRGELLCLNASKQCQLTALRDKSRTPYFAACQEAEDTCLLSLEATKLDRGLMIGVKFPDNTVVIMLDGKARITHVGGIKLSTPIR